MRKITPRLTPVRLLDLWDRLRTSFWFLPALMGAAAMALAFALVELDGRLGAEAVRRLGGIYAFGPEGARAVLSAVASSMITVAGLTFSITMLTLQLAATQFGPRLQRNFMRDRANQVVLGAFVATFVYCLLVLRSVRGAEGASFTPHIAVAAGVVLAVAALGTLIFFIHHIATAIRIETVLSTLAAEALAAVDRLYPERVGNEARPPEDAPDVPRNFERTAVAVPAPASGYVQRVDGDALMRAAEKHDLLVVVAARPGRFVTEGAPLLLVDGAERPQEAELQALAGAMVVGPDRTPDQDLGHALRRIVEIAQRALSPGVNDPTTALYCLDRLGEALGRLAERCAPTAKRLDGAGRLRLVTETADTRALVCDAFAAIGRYALRDADVIAHLLAMVHDVADRSSPNDASALRALAADIRAASLAAAALAADRARLAGAP
jgi:uncharacterized membrane protein